MRRQRRRRNRKKWGFKVSFSDSAMQRFGKSALSKIFDKAEDSKVQRIYSLLPKKDCGSCGYESCYECATAIARGEAPPDACKVAGKKIRTQVEEILKT